MTTPDSRPRSDRLADIPFSPLRRVFARSAELAAQGRDILDFSLGRPDFDTPGNVKAAAAAALAAGRVHYTSNYGIPELGEAIARKLARDSGLAYEPGTEIVPTNGVGEGVVSTFLALLEPGDDVVVLEPAWHHYRVVARVAGANPVPVATRAADGFLPDPDEVAAAVTPRTRMLVVNSPNNPTGVVYPAELLQRLGRIAAEAGALLVSDEIYDGLVYEGTHVSVAALDDNRERTVLLNGFSKSHSMTGWRIGYVAAPRHLADRIVRVHQHNTVCPTSFVQYGAVEAYEGDQEQVRSMRAEFARRRDLACGMMREIPGLELVVPGGAFYAFPRLPFADPARDLTDLLLDEAGIACAPGHAFGSAYREHLRFSFAASSEDIRRGLERLAGAVGRLTGGDGAGPPSHHPDPRRGA